MTWTWTLSSEICDCEWDLILNELKMELKLLLKSVTAVRNKRGSTD